jgi:hypothetical protein
MPTFGDPPITVDEKEFKKHRDTLKTVVNGFRDKQSKEVNKLWNTKKDLDAQLNLLTEHFLIGKLTARQDAFLSFARILTDVFGVQLPSAGALWGGEGAQDQAKLKLQGTQGTVLSESGLGQLAQTMKIPPQGPKKNETGPEFAERNRLALMFWGAISALYAESLTGDIHVWMPKGLTVGSIFWNDELPVLMERKRKGEVFNLIFHIDPGNWDATVTLDELVIGGAYVADKKGYYQGRMDLKQKHNPPTGVDPNKDLKDSMTLALSSPIKVATVKQAMLALLQYKIMAKKNELLDPSERLSKPALARLASWYASARLAEKGN